MSLNIKDPEAHKLAQQLATETGETMTSAVIQAIRERLAELHRSVTFGLGSCLLSSAAPQCAAELGRTMPARCLLQAAEAATNQGVGSTQRGRVVRPACFQSFSHCQMPGVLSRTR